MSYLTELTTLMNDSLSNKVAVFANEDAAKYTDQAIREAFFEILGDDKLTWQGWRNHKNEIFTVIENVLTTNLPKAWENSPFYDQFVEVKNGALGDTNEYVIDQDGILVASRFSGNHWDVDRQKLQGKRSFSVPTEWIYIHVYDELERFLNGATSLPEMMTKLQNGFQNEIDARIYTSFNGIGTYLPEAFKETGAYVRETMMDLIQRVQIASQSNVILAGTKTALAAIAEGIDSKWISNAQQEEMATKGALLNLTGLGVTAMEIPQVFVRGTYDFKIDNTSIYVLPNNTRPIKLFYEGNTRALDYNENQTHDQTVGTIAETKLGTAVIMPSLFGKYTVE